MKNMNRYLWILAIFLIQSWWILLILVHPGTVKLLQKVVFFPTRNDISVPTDRALSLSFGKENKGGVFFTENEISHLSDVAKVTEATIFFRSLIGVLGWGMALVLIANSGPSRKAWSFVGRIYLLIFAIVTISVLLFQQFFIYFHQVFFPRGNWMFPESSILIKIFPQEFWQSYLVLIALLILVCAIFNLLIAGLWYEVD